MLAKYDTSIFTKDQKVHSDLHHDSNSELTWISKINQTNSMIILKKTCFSASCSLVRAALVSRLRSSRDSDSQVKSGCSHLIRDGLTL